MRGRPFFTIVTFVFHICALSVPLFFMAHIVLWYESFGVLWLNIPNGVADIMTVFVLFACVFFFIRRLVIPEVKMVSESSDFFLLLFIFTSFLTGFLAFHQFGPYRPLLVLHIISSLALMIMIPFSRLWHMIVYPFSRYYMGTDFGANLKSRDW